MMDSPIADGVSPAGEKERKSTELACEFLKERVELVTPDVGIEPVKIKTVTLSTGYKVNALTPRVLNEIAAYFRNLQTEEQTGIVFVISSGGNKLDEFGRDTFGNLDNSLAHNWCTSTAIDALDAILNASDRTVALIDGYALAAGLELALGAGRVLMTERDDGRDVLGLPEARMGFIPAIDGIFSVLGRMTHENLKAGCELILGARIIRSKEAVTLGIVDDTVGDDGLVRAQLLAAKLVAELEMPRKVSLDNAEMPNLSDVGRFEVALHESDAALRFVFEQIGGSTRLGARKIVNEAFRNLLETGRWQTAVAMELDRLRKRKD